MNVSMEDGEGSGGFRKAYSESIIPALEAFRPELIVISAGEGGAMVAFAKPVDVECLSRGVRGSCFSRALSGLPCCPALVGVLLLSLSLVPT